VWSFDGFCVEYFFCPVPKLRLVPAKTLVNTFFCGFIKKLLKGVK
jgi:hypothetical protein